VASLTVSDPVVGVIGDGAAGLYNGYDRDSVGGRDLGSQRRDLLRWH
jgi:hypothetical protein